MAQSDDLGNGVQLALDATMAQFGNEPDRLVELLNASTPPELSHAVAYLAQRYQEVLTILAHGDRERATNQFREEIAATEASQELDRGKLPHDEVPRD
ncbi:MAG: hypothetical protein QM747_17925 [Nocardioides sp.]